METHILPFERKLYEIEAGLRHADTEDERYALGIRRDRELALAYARITPWQRVQLARHPQRPRMLDYTRRIFDDFIELHGDRVSGEDPAMICGIARFQGRSLLVAGQQKGAGFEEQQARNFGMAHPSGYRKALRIFRLAEKLRLPIMTMVDTPAAHPGIEAEQTGQGFAIAQNLRAMASLKTPVFSVVLSEGGSGGAIGIAVADWIAMFKYAVYMICPPERCAEILWRDVSKKALAAAALKVTADDLHALGIIDRVLPETCGAAHHNPDAAADALAHELEWFLHELDKGVWTLERRRNRIRRWGLEGMPCESP